MIDKDKVKEELTNEQIIIILESLGSKDYKIDTQNHLMFPTICHGGNSHKLYYYESSKSFNCYTNCGKIGDIFALVEKVLNCSFSEAINYVCSICGISNISRQGFISVKTLTDDWELINKYKNIATKEEKVKLKIYPRTILDYYINLPHEEWLKEGITFKTLKKYNIRFDLIHNKIIIPHEDVDNDLIGIRGRALNEIDIINGKKYMPVYLEKQLFNHPLTYNLYGLNKNIEAIKRIGKIMIFESEKSVLKCDSFYGDNNFTVACCGSTITMYQRNMILDLGVKEVFIAFDKEYEEAFTPESDKYSEKILNLCYKFSSYCTVYAVWDTEGLLNLKESPCDKGEDVLEQLMKNKFEVLTNEL